MQTASEPLPSDLQQLQRMVLDLQAELLLKDDQINHLLEQFRLAQHRQFGKSSESQAQLGLFNEAEKLGAARDEIEPEQESITYTRNKPKRKPLPDDLLREQVIHDLEKQTRSVATVVMTCTGWVKR